MDANTLLMLGGLAYSWWKSRPPALTPEQAAPSIEVEPPDEDVAVPALTVHLVGESEAGKNDGLLIIAFPVAEVPETPALSGRRRGFGQTAPPPDVVARYRTVYRPSGPVRATVPRPAQRPAPGMQAPKPPKPTALHSAMPVAGAVLATIPLIQLGAAKLRGQEVGVGQVLTATGFTAASLVAQFTPPVVGGGVSAAAHTVQYFAGNINAASTAQYLGNLAKDGIRMAQVVVPGLGAVTAVVDFVRAFSDMDGPNFGRHIGEGIGTLLGTGASLLGGPLAGAIAIPALRWIGGKIGAWWDRKQAIAQVKALEGITGASVDAMLAEQWATWGEQKQAAVKTLDDHQAWWDSPAGTAAYQSFAQREETYDPALLPEAGEGLSTEIVNLEPVPTELTAEDLARLGLTEEEIQIYQEGAPMWEGGFGVPQPEDAVTEPVPDTAPQIARTWDEMVALSMAPRVVKLVGAWDALIHAYAGQGAIAECARFAAPGSGARCLAEYADGSRTYFDAGTDLSTVPGSIIS